MKKALVKFKHWLIRKLGGYTEQYVHKTEARYIPAYQNPVTIQARTKADAALWYMRVDFKESCDPTERFKQHVMNGLRDQLMDEIWEHRDDLVDIKYCDNFEEDTITIQATLRLYKFN